MGKILVVGDIMLDIYIFGIVSRISPEAPVPILLEKEDGYRYALGGGANVAVNLVATGSEVDLFSVVGKDENGHCLCELLKNKGIHTDFIVEDETRPTTTKKRFVGQNNQQVLRVDLEKTMDVSEELWWNVFKMLEQQIAVYDIILLSDYKKGFLTSSLCRHIIEVAKKNNVPVLVDVKDYNYAKYKGATLIKPNRSELRQLTGLNTETIPDVIEAAKFLCNQADVEYVLATLGEDGMLLVKGEELIKHITAMTREVYDVTGAGDTSIAYLATEWAKGTQLVEAMEIANIAAGIQVSKVGTSVVLPQEVEQVRFPSKYIFNENGIDRNKEDLFSVINEIKNKGKKIVFTNGCFDILHSGHITYLKAAKELGDCLIVGVNSDDSVKRLKGEERPINNVSDRLMLLSALECVDFVIEFNEDTPLELIKQIKPDILVKGGDYDVSKIVGADVVSSYGGIVTTIPYVEGKSTTNLIKCLSQN